jgi:hypothetical protein
MPVGFGMVFIIGIVDMEDLLRKFGAFGEFGGP